MRTVGDRFHPHFYRLEIIIIHNNPRRFQCGHHIILRLLVRVEDQVIISGTIVGRKGCLKKVTTANDLE